MSLFENKEEKSGSPVERDVLGLEKQIPGTAKPGSKPNRIFIGLLVIILLIISYWVFIKH